MWKFHAPGLRPALMALAVAAGAGGPAAAQEVRITEDTLRIEFAVNGQTHVIERGQDTAATVTGEYARTARQCPPFCITKMGAGRGVALSGELEVIDFLVKKVATGEGILMDTRMPEGFAAGTIPGAVNVPFVTLSSDNPYRNDILAALGARPVGGDTFDFADVMELTLFADGPWSDQAARAIAFLREAGYPADRLHYYRGGMQDWHMFGLSVSRLGQDTIQTAGGQP
jgi:rhodanese-related sulfurtransferase